MEIWEDFNGLIESIFLDENADDRVIWKHTSSGMCASLLGARAY